LAQRLIALVAGRQQMVDRVARDQMDKALA
jgi:hypothetical protein